MESIDPVNILEDTTDFFFSRVVLTALMITFIFTFLVIILGVSYEKLHRKDMKKRKRKIIKFGDCLVSCYHIDSCCPSPSMCGYCKHNKAKRTGDNYSKVKKWKGINED